MVTKGAKHLGSILAPIAADEYLLDQAVEALLAYSLLKRDVPIGMLSIHRLVQAVLCDAMTEEELTTWKQRVMLFLNAVCPDARKVEKWLECELGDASLYSVMRWVCKRKTGVFEISQARGFYLIFEGLDASQEVLTSVSSSRLKSSPLT